MTSKQNNKDYIVGMYVRLSRDDERAGESLSIENQKAILNEYIEKQGFTLYDIYVDDGISGTTFDRPGIKRLLDDAKQGVINTVLVKDMSRFGRNYIMVGQYLDYVFPAFGIRFIALSDNIDTEETSSRAYSKRQEGQKRNVSRSIRLHARNGRETHVASKRRSRADRKTDIRNAGARIDAEKDRGCPERRKGLDAKRLQAVKDWRYDRTLFAAPMEHFRSPHALG